MVAAQATMSRVTADHFATDVAPRWGDLDAQGHVNNSLVADYLQEARADFLMNGPNRHLLGGGVVVVAHQLEYLRPVEFTGAPVRVELWPVKVGAARFELAYRATHEGHDVFRARTVLCPFDFERQHPRRLTADERTHFTSLLDDDLELRKLPLVHLGGRGHEFGFRVRWSDLDSYGHVNNVCFYDYLQEARIALTTQADPSMARQGSIVDAPEPMGPRRMWLVARQDVDYLAQMEHRAEGYVVRTGVAALGNSSVTLAAEVVDPLHDQPHGGRVHARGRTVLVCADESGRPVPLAGASRAALEALLVRSPNLSRGPSGLLA
ncbi:acyl-CoA thioesterase [Luteococcus sanguinis]|uniref:Acyl-CoA thioesterase n=1 Tax=Luteococcus sanguinis TaxID=174038 RepID=A0ABW1WYH3_9ACTN